MQNRTRTTRSSSSLRLESGHQLFSAVYFSRGTLSQKRGEKGTTGGPRLWNSLLLVVILTQNLGSLRSIRASWACHSGFGNEPDRNPSSRKLAGSVSGFNWSNQQESKTMNQKGTCLKFKGNRLPTDQKKSSGFSD